MKKINPIFIIVSVALVFVSVHFYNKKIEKDEYNSKMKEIVEERKRYRGSDNVNNSSYLTNNEAVYASQKFVKRKLKSPSTADFQPIFQAKVKRENNTYTINSYVDSQNGFGATIRSNYIVKLKRKSNGDISLISLNIY